MNQSARGFLPAVISIAIIVIILKIGIAQFVRVSMVQNEARAQEMLRLLSVAFENYARDHLGTYAQQIANLTASEPAYLGNDVLSRPSQDGYVFSCERMEPLGYQCSAVPVNCAVTGRHTYSISTGGSFQSRRCVPNEE